MEDISTFLNYAYNRQGKGSRVCRFLSFKDGTNLLQDRGQQPHLIGYTDKLLCERRL